MKREEKDKIQKGKRKMRGKGGEKTIKQIMKGSKTIKA